MAAPGTPQAQYNAARSSQPAAQDTDDDADGDALANAALPHATSRLACTCKALAYQACKSSPPSCHPGQCCKEVQKCDLKSMRPPALVSTIGSLSLVRGVEGSIGLHASCGQLSGMNDEVCR